MIFEKDPKTRYVDMAIYIDDHIYSGNFDEELVYKYLYFLIYMLSKKKKYFASEKSYDDFSIWFATKMYVRLTDKRQFDDNERIEKITSVLNYIKGILFAKRTEYLAEIEYQSTLGKFNSKYVTDFDDNALIDYYRSSIESDNNMIIKNSILDLFNDIPKMIMLELRKSPYKNNEVMINNLYISCLLTFIKTIQPTNAQLDKLKKIAQRNPSTDISKISSNKDVEVVLWNIPNYLYDYVKLIFNRVKISLIEDIKEGVSLYTYNNHDLVSIINSNHFQNMQEV